MNATGTSSSVIVRKTYRLKLYPNKAQRAAFGRSAGSCRWLWNHLLDMQVKQYEREKTFTFFNDMSKILPKLKRDVPWLGETHANALVRVCKSLDRALRDSFPKKGLKKGFPRFKAKGRSRDAYYVIGQAVRIETNKVVLPKVGPVRFRAGRAPEGRIVGGTVSRTADDWFVTLQCDVEVDVPTVAPEAETTTGVDLGLTHLIVASDGVRVKAPRHLRLAQKRLRRAQRALSRRKKGSANRVRQARRVARIHARVVNCRSDTLHKATRSLVDRSSVVVTETLGVKGMARNERLSFSISDAGWGELVRQVAYKCDWAGKTHLKADRLFASTQTCSGCGARKTGGAKLLLHHRTYRCEACGLEIDRDDNAAANLRLWGLTTLGIALPGSWNDVGQVMPERDEPQGASDACGDPSAGPGAHVPGRRGSRKQEVGLGCEGLAA